MAESANPERTEKDNQIPVEWQLRRCSLIKMIFPVRTLIPTTPVSLVNAQSLLFKSRQERDLKTWDFLAECLLTLALIHCNSPKESCGLAAASAHGKMLVTSPLCRAALPQHSVSPCKAAWNPKSKRSALQRGKDLTRHTRSRHK